MQRVVLDDGSAVTVTVRDGLLMDDILTQQMKAVGYRVMTGKSVHPAPSRKLKDYLIKTGIILE